MCKCNHLYHLEIWVFGKFYVYVSETHTYTQLNIITSVAQTIKNLPAMQETHVRSLGHEDTLKKGMATHSSALAWRIPWTEEPGGLQTIGSQRVRHD